MSQPTWGLLAEFESVDTLCVGADAMRQAGFTRWDVYSPFPIHWQVKAQPPTRLPFLVLACGITGMLAGLFLTWWASATSFDVFGLPVNFQGYPFQISGKPLWSLPAFVPVIFELTILFSALGAVFGMIALNRLPRLHHPLFASEAFRRVTQDRFFIAVEADDPQFEQFRVRDLLRDHGAVSVETIAED